MKLAKASLEFAAPYISEECIVKTEAIALETQSLLQNEIASRCEDGSPLDHLQADGAPTTRRDTYIMRNQNHARLAQPPQNYHQSQRNHEKMSQSSMRYDDT